MIAKSTVYNFLFPQKCPVCRTLLRLGEEKSSVMCPVCRLKWTYEKQRLCRECGLPPELCTCMPSLMKMAGVHELLKLCFYESDSGSAGDKLVLYLKDYRDRRVFRSIAKELCTRLRKYLADNGINEDGIVFTYAPRSRAMLEKRGFDQAKYLARECAIYMNAYFAPAINRKYFAGKQKGLAKKDRIQNAKKSFALVKNIDFKGATVILVDDVVTTGASFAECTKLLISEGAGKVICLCVAKTGI